MSVSVFAPISIGNLSVGFDSLGLAVSPIDCSLVGDTVSISKSSSNELTVTGSHANCIPQDESNIVWRALCAFEQALQRDSIACQPVQMTLQKNIPVSSGLGSSACSIVASLVALNEFYQRPLDNSRLLTLMGQMEATISGSLHFDNVAPSFLGGMQLMLTDPKKITQSIPVLKNIYWLVAYPDVEISTKAAREILPDAYSRQTMIEFGQNLASFIDACHRDDQAQAFQSLTDVIAEPFRHSLIPGFTAVKTRLNALGALAVGISGSGPTLFAATNSLEVATQSANWLKKNFLQSEKVLSIYAKLIWWVPA